MARRSRKSPPWLKATIRSCLGDRAKATRFRGALLECVYHDWEMGGRRPLTKRDHALIRTAVKRAAAAHRVGAARRAARRG
jgi:hypothetical protein